MPQIQNTPIRRTCNKKINFSPLLFSSYTNGPFPEKNPGLWGRLPQIRYFTAFFSTLILIFAPLRPTLLAKKGASACFAEAPCTLFFIKWDVILSGKPEFYCPEPCYYIFLLLL